MQRRPRRVLKRSFPTLGVNDLAAVDQVWIAIGLLSAQLRCALGADSGSTHGVDPFGAHAGVFALQIVCCLTAAAKTERLDVMAFRQRGHSSFGERLQVAVDDPPTG